MSQYGGFFSRADAPPPGYAGDSELCITWTR